jgi:GNAT superfamily N-acetyltransferase
MTEPLHAVQAPFVIRPATKADIPAISVMIREFAAAEDRPNRVTATEDDLREALFTENPAADVLIAVDEGGEAVGYALFYSTFVPYYARSALFLKNLFVRERAQRRGLGTALLRQVAGLAVERGCCRLEWDTLPENDRARRFYDAIGLSGFEKRPFYRLEDDELTALVDRLG